MIFHFWMSRSSAGAGLSSSVAVFERLLFPELVWFPELAPVWPRCVVVVLLAVMLMIKMDITGLSPMTVWGQHQCPYRAGVTHSCCVWWPGRRLADTVCWSTWFLFTCSYYVVLFVLESCLFALQVQVDINWHIYIYVTAVFHRNKQTSKEMNKRFWKWKPTPEKTHMDSTDIWIHKTTLTLSDLLLLTDQILVGDECIMH